MYLSESIKLAKVEVIDHLKNEIKSISDKKDDNSKLKIIESIYNKLNSSNNEIPKQNFEAKPCS